jgi:predicted Zn-dependent protease
VYDDQNLANYVNQVGLYVSKFSDYPERRYMFEVLDSEQINAFACPGGYILVTLGAIKHARNEAQLAHVLGHEVTHVGEKHMFNTLQKMSSEEMTKINEETEAAYQHLPPEVTVRERPDPEQSAAGSMLARYLSGSSAGLSIIQAAKAGMSLILEKGLGAELEYEADQEGVKTAIKAGYQPQALVDFLCRIKEGTRTGRCKLTPEKKADGKTAADHKTPLDKTHPPIPERIKKIRVVLKEMGAREMTGALGTARFKQFVEPTLKKGKKI